MKKASDPGVIGVDSDRYFVRLGTDEACDDPSRVDNIFCKGRGNDLGIAPAVLKMNNDGIVIKKVRMAR